MPGHDSICCCKKYIEVDLMVKTFFVPNHRIDSIKRRGGGPSNRFQEHSVQGRELVSIILCCYEASSSSSQIQQFLRGGSDAVHEIEGVFERLGHWPQGKDHVANHSHKSKLFPSAFAYGERKHYGPKRAITLLLHRAFLDTIRHLHD